MQNQDIGYLELFLLFVKIGVVTIGGGYVMIPLLQEEFVEKRKYMEIKEFASIIAVAQAGPGGVAVSTLPLLWLQTEGVTWGNSAAVGTVLPSFLAIILLSAWLAPGNRVLWKASSPVPPRQWATYRCCLFPWS